MNRVRFASGDLPMWASSQIRRSALELEGDLARLRRGHEQIGRGDDEHRPGRQRRAGAEVAQEDDGRLRPPAATSPGQTPVTAIAGRPRWLTCAPMLAHVLDRDPGLAGAGYEADHRGAVHQRIEAFGLRRE